jgi:hypothetical protein
MIGAVAYQVFIERARDPSPLATVTLANAIAARFGLPSEAISARLAQGRFRVKSGVDLDTAERFVADLEALGAECTIVDEATDQPVARPRAVSPAAVAPAAARPVGDYQSGLAAAFGAAAGAGQAQDIGALGDPTSGTFSLATIDGADETRGAAAPSSQAFAPPGADDAPPADLFAPPDAEEEIALGIDSDVSGPPVRPPVSRPGPAQQEALLSLLPEGEAPGASTPVGNPIERLLGTLAQRPGVRTATGAVLAMLLGFLVAHGVGALRESSAFDTPRANVAAADATYRNTTVGTVGEQAELSAAFQKQRAAQISIMSESKRSIAMLSGAIWLIVSVGAGLAWSRMINWDRWA